MQKWFEKLNEKVELIHETSATKQQLENRFTALLTVCTNIRKDIDTVRKDLESVRKDLRVSGDKYDKYEARISTLELAVRELDRRFSH